MKTVRLKIDGMHCASCSTIIENTLKKEDWMQSVSVNIATHTWEFVFDQEKISESEIHALISKTWFRVVESISEDNTQRNYLYRFIVAGILSIPVALTMFIDVSSISFLSGWWFDLIVMLAGTIVIFGAWCNFHVWCIKKLLIGQTNMDTLVSLSTVVAYIYSIYALVQTYLYDIHTMYFHFMEWASFIITFLLLWKYLETKSKRQASQAIKKLMELQAKDAIVIVDGKEVSKPVDTIKVWDIVLVKPWQKIPVDSMIIEWTASIDESMLSGESIPVTKTIDDEVFWATIATDWRLLLRVHKQASQSFLSHIIASVEKAQNSKPAIQKQVDKISAIFVPVVLCIALLAFVLHYMGWMVWVYEFFGIEYTSLLQKAMLVFVSTVVIACPCAMWLATPMAITVATWTWAQRWILIQSWQALEKSQHIDAVVFDKTWTLTQWKPRIVQTKRSDESSSSSHISAIVALCTSSHHPLSEAVVSHFADTKPATIQNVQEYPWKWVTWSVWSVVYGYGNKQLSQKIEADWYDDFAQDITSRQSQWQTVNLVIKQSKVVWIIWYMDTLKSDSFDAVTSLLDSNIQVYILSWDTKATVASIAKQLWVTDFFAEVLPHQKAEKVSELQSAWKRVAFVWDWINDAPALAQSDLGVAMWQWSDIAIESADIVLVHSSPSTVPQALSLAQKTYAIIKQNLFWAFAYNAILIPIAALWLLMPWFAWIAMSLSSISVVLNSLRLKKTP